ncbi:hypothetical protein DXT74_07740 [Chromobacterium sp. Rain0013]|nr:hypothetical protein DXT74_07740 [Chromobacterium sp. Rain0013]
MLAPLRRDGWIKGVESRFEMLMSHVHIPFSQRFSPCLALALQPWSRLSNRAKKSASAGGLRRKGIAANNKGETMMKRANISNL